MIVDIHVHMAGVGDQSYNGEKCYLSDDFRATLGFKVMLLLYGVSGKDLKDAKIQSITIDKINESELVDGAVLLAMDRVYNAQSQPAPYDCPSGEKIHLYTPNECVAYIVNREPKNPKLFFGASVHPDRFPCWSKLEDYLNALHDQGAVLIKWLPSAQNIDPLRKEYKRFYRKLVDLNLPLLCHVGAEHTIPVPIARKDNDDWEKDGWKYTMLNRPDCVVAALEEGVTVIAAHCSTPVYKSDPDYTNEFIRLMYSAIDNGWKLYADLSAFALPPLVFPARCEAAKRIAAETGIHDRLMLGSDFPIPVGYIGPKVVEEFDPQRVKDFLGISNPFDRNVRFLRNLGFPDQVFHNGAKVLGIEP